MHYPYHRLSGRLDRRLSEILTFNEWKKLLITEIDWSKTMTRFSGKKENQSISVINNYFPDHLNKSISVINNYFPDHFNQSISVINNFVHIIKKLNGKKLDFFYILKVLNQWCRPICLF